MCSGCSIKWSHRRLFLLLVVWCLLDLVGGSRNRLLVRVPDSWSKGCKFKSQQERWENFLLQSQLCVLTLIRCLFHPRVTTVARKRPWSFFQKCRCQFTPKQAYTLDPTKSEWADYAANQALCGNLSGKQAHMQLIKEHLVTVVSARWAAVDWSWPEEWN